MGLQRVGHNWATFTVTKLKSVLIPSQYTHALWIMLFWLAKIIVKIVKKFAYVKNKLPRGWMASPTQWTWVWTNSGSWWWTGRPGMLRFMGSQKVRHDWVTELNWYLLFLQVLVFWLFIWSYHFQQTIWLAKFLFRFFHKIIRKNLN